MFVVGTVVFGTVCMVIVRTAFSSNVVRRE